MIVTSFGSRNVSDNYVINYGAVKNRFFAKVRNLRRHWASLQGSMAFSQRCFPLGQYPVKQGQDDRRFGDFVAAVSRSSLWGLTAHLAGS
jgi:hypothetical protein